MYQVNIEDKARKQILAIPPPHFHRLKRAINGLSQNPRPAGAIRLKEQTGYRIRVGDYRILYEVDDITHIVIIYRVKHRREVYR